MLLLGFLEFLPARCGGALSAAMFLALTMVDVISQIMHDAERGES